MRANAKPSQCDAGPAAGDHWRLRIRRGGLAVMVAGAMLALGAAGDAQAQTRSAVCLQLESELARLQAPQAPASNATIRRMERARRTAQAAEQRARRAGCFQRGFLIFQPQKPRACRKLESDFRQADGAYRALAAQVGGTGRPRAGQGVRDRVIRALAANDCGSQYARYANANRRNVFSFFLGPQSYVNEPMAPRGGGYRTLCVRKCDGYYFPISFSTIPSYFDKDAQTCRAACPGSEAQLYVYRNPGQQPEQAQTPSGEPITALANAFRYRNEMVDGCTCRGTQIAESPDNASRVQMSFSPGLIAEEHDVRSIPMPRKRPSRYAITDIEHPSMPVEVEKPPVRTSETTKRPVRIIGQELFLAQ